MLVTDLADCILLFFVLLFEANVVPTAAPHTRDSLTIKYVVESRSSDQTSDLRASGGKQLNEKKQVLSSLFLVVKSVFVFCLVNVDFVVQFQFL